MFGGIKGFTHASGPTTLSKGVNSGTRIPVNGRGPGAYLLIIDQPVSMTNCKVWAETPTGTKLWTTFATSGRPRQDYLVWHQDPGQTVERFYVDVYSNPGGPIVANLYLKGPGVQGPSGPGWGNERGHQH